MKTFGDGTVLWGEARNPRTASPGISFMQMNFRGSETTWLLCYQEMMDGHLHPDVILVQDPLSLSVWGKTFSGDIEQSGQ